MSLYFRGLTLLCLMVAFAVMADTVPPLAAVPALQTASAPTAKLPPWTIRLGRSRPLIAVVGENYWTELTDYVVPFGILTAAEAADVVALGTKPGPIRMFPAPVNVLPQATIAQFDQEHPEGADYVVVPAVHRDDDPTLIAWLRQQAARGATVVGVCDGVWVLARAGLLEGHQATGHWYSIDKLRSEFPGSRFVNGSRYVVDGRIVTTTGVTAAVPVSLAMVEAIAGRARALAVANALGLPNGWSQAHESPRFQLDWQRRWTVARNATAFWAYEDLGLAVAPGVDEIALALEANAWSATFKSTVYTVANSKAPLRTRRGLTIVPDRSSEEAKKESLIWLPPSDPGAPLRSLDRALQGITARYGAPTADWVALQMEYPTGSE